MRIVLLCCSVLSDHDGGDAQFLRGVVRELVARGHHVVVYEPFDTRRVKAAEMPSPLGLSSGEYPTIRPRRYMTANFDLDAALDRAGLVVVNGDDSPELVHRIGQRRSAGGKFRLLYHDTRPRTSPRLDLDGFDGVLALGGTIKDRYERRGWGRRAWTWHRAVDVRLFRPAAREVAKHGDLVWVGECEDPEHETRLRAHLLEPITDLGLVAKVHGAGYPESFLFELAQRSIEIGGPVPNFRVPDVLAHYTLTAHISRRPMSPGVPSIRLFEALACESALVSTLWDDAEGLFSPGKDYLVAADPAQMRAHLRTLLHDGGARRELARHGRETILRRHTCAHRVDELGAIAQSLGAGEHGALAMEGHSL